MVGDRRLSAGRRVGRVPAFWGAIGVALAGLALAPLAWADAGAPLPRCSADPAKPSQFYLMRYMEPGTANTAPKTILDLATVPATGAVTATTIWDGATAPRVSPRDLSLTSGATVAGGMGKDGYIYAMRAVGATEAGWDLQGNTWTAPGNEWRTHTRYYEMYRYGRGGVDNLGIVQGLGTYRTVANDPATQVAGVIDLRQGPNFNAADIDPVTGTMYLANFRNLRTGATGPFPQVYRIDVTQSPPRYVDTLQLQANLPGNQSGDFAIDAAGQWAYGIANNSFTAQAYRFRLSDGTVEVLGAPFISLPWGGGARLTNNPAAMAFYGFGTRVMSIPAGTLGATQSTATSDSADAAACLPKFVATLQCSPANLVDSANNVSQCTVTLDKPAPAGGVEVALTPPPANPRYTSTCGASLTVPAGQTSAPCTITAAPNTVPGDGFVDATVALAPPDPLADYELGTPTSATVRIDDDDLYTVSLSCTPSELFDSPNNTAICTIASDYPAPAAGLTVALVPPAANARYQTTCGTSVALAPGQSSETCTITATPNTVPGDGDVPATLSLAAPPAGSGYQLGTPAQATVMVRDDDVAAVLPTAQLVCTPTRLVDSPNNVSICTVTLSSPAPAGGLSLTLTPPGVNPRYTTSCGATLPVAAGASSSAPCTITATPNTVPGDGAVVATLVLGPGAGYTVGANPRAQVTVDDDDDLAPVPTLGFWGLVLLALGLGGFAWRRQHGQS